jgi:DNA-binding PucR family transcriptional regulator
LSLGPTVAPAAAADSWALAVALLRAESAGALSGLPGDAESRGDATSVLLRVDDHLADLLLFESRDLAGRIAARRLAPLVDLTPKARGRMRETALAHLRHDGNAVAMAAAMNVHPQTARYRIARLRELLGDQLDDPDARFELQLALRAESA